MKVINLDRFKNVQTVELDGKTYEVKGITVDMYLNDPLVEKLDQSETGKDRISIISEVLVKLSNIPKKVIDQQSLAMLTALLSVVQGNDPNAILDEIEASAKVPNE